jgi:hypothetical protein
MQPHQENSDVLKPAYQLIRLILAYFGHYKQFQVEISVKSGFWPDWGLNPGLFTVAVDALTIELSGHFGICTTLI